MKKILFLLTASVLAIGLILGNISVFAQAESANTNLNPTSSFTQPKPIAVPVASTNTAPTSNAPTSNMRKCGVNTFQVFNQCGNDGATFRGAYWQCYDGYEEKQLNKDLLVCKSSEEWQEYGKKICTDRCSDSVSPSGVNAKPAKPIAPNVLTPIVTGSGTIIVPACYANEKSMRKYDQLITELQKAETAGDKKLAQEISEKIISLKKEISLNKSDCIGASGTATQVIIAEPVKPTVVNSGQDISSYYRQKFQNVTATNQNTSEQVEALENLRSEIDGLIGKLIQNKKEINASEISGLVSEVKILPGEIKARDISVKTTDNKIIVGIGAKSVSVEPKEKDVVLNDNGINVTAESVSIKDNVVSVGDSEIGLAPSEIIKKLQITPVSMELKEENSKAIYEIKTDEQRKLFGFVPIKIQKSTNADAVNGSIISEKRPWWSFLSTQ